MKFSELEKCPFCNNDEFYIKQKIDNQWFRFATKFNKKLELSDKSIDLSIKDFAYCCKCHAHLGNIISDNISDKIRRHELTKNNMKRNATYACCSKKDLKMHENKIEIDGTFTRLVKDVASDYIEIKGYDCNDIYISIRKRGYDIVAIIVKQYTIELEWDEYGEVYAKDEDEAWALADEKYGVDMIGIADD